MDIHGYVQEMERRAYLKGWALGLLMGAAAGSGAVVMLVALFN